MKLNFSIKSGPTIKPTKLDAFEQRLGHSFPEDYREFMVKYNGGDPERTKISGPLENKFGIRFFFELTKSKNNGLLFYYNLMRERIPEGFLSIANDECGNVFIINLNADDEDYGVVYFWDHEQEADTDEGEVPSYDNLTKVSENFQELLDCMVPDPIIFDDDDEIDDDDFVSTNFFRIVSTEELRNFPPKTMKLLTEKDLRDLGPEIVSNMNPEYLKTLDPDLLRELTDG